MSDRETRPWGWFETIQTGSNYKVKKLFVKHGCRISLQSHEHRDEHWVVVTGSGVIELNEIDYPIKTGEYIFIPKGSKHRICAYETQDVELIEVQMGICEESDITRYQDDYGRAV
jgi:mannose-6-phosphate isomerase-like protein (cupin superfamily)